MSNKATVSGDAGDLAPTIGNPPVYSVFEVRSVPAPDNTDRAFAGQFLEFVGSETTVPQGAQQNDKIALYAAVRRDNDRPDDVWAANVLADIFTGANTSNVIALEVDVNNHDSDMPFQFTRLMDGIGINSGLSKKAGTALHVGIINPGAEWRRGILIHENAVDGCAVQIGDKGSPATALFVTQWAETGRGVVIRRKTDQASGNLLECRDSEDTVSLFKVDASGGVVASGTVSVVGQSAHLALDASLTTGGNRAEIRNIRQDGVNKFQVRDDQLMLELSNPAVDETGVIIRRNKSGAVGVDRVFIGPRDSAGVGFRSLRIPN